MGRQLAGHPAACDCSASTRSGLRQDPGQGALRAVPQRRAVPADARARGHERSRPPPASRRAISRSTAISAIRRAAPSTPNGRLSCASSSRRSSPRSDSADHSHRGGRRRRGISIAGQRFITTLTPRASARAAAACIADAELHPDHLGAGGDRCVDRRTAQAGCGGICRPCRRALEHRRARRNRSRRGSSRPRRWG